MKRLILLGLLLIVISCVKTVKEPVYKYIYLKPELPDLYIGERPTLKSVLIKKYIIDNQTSWCMSSEDLKNLINNKRGYESTIEEYERVIQLYLNYKNQHKGNNN